MIPALNDAEAAIYFINYHSRLPYFTLDAKNTSLRGTFPEVSRRRVMRRRFRKIFACTASASTALNPSAGFPWQAS